MDDLLITRGLRTGMLQVPTALNPVPPSYGPRVKEFQKTIEIRDPRGVSGGASALTYGAFYGTYVDGAGDTYLQGGQVKCGESEVLADYKIIDSVTGPVEVAGSKLVIEITLDGYVEDGVLLAGITATAIAYVTPVATTIPTDTLPTAAGEIGKLCYLEVGRFTDTSFLPSGIGHFLVSFCGTGSYSVRRY